MSKNTIMYLFFSIVMAGFSYGMENPGRTEVISTNRTEIAITSQDSLDLAVLQEFQDIVRDYWNRREAAKESNGLAVLLTGFWYANDYFDLLNIQRTSHGKKSAGERLAFMKGKDFFYRGYSKSKDLILGNEPSTYSLNISVKPSVVVKNFGKELIFIDCGIAYQLAYYRVILKYWGEEIFDSYFSSRKMRPMFAPDIACTMLNDLVDLTKLPQTPGTPGTHYYVSGNPYLKAKDIMSEAQGFNLLVRDQEKLIGFGLNPDGVTIDDVKAELVNHFNKPPYNSSLVSEATWQTIRPPHRSREAELFDKIQNVMKDAQITSVDDDEIISRLKLRIAHLYGNSSVDYIIDAIKQNCSANTVGAINSLKFSLLKQVKETQSRKNKKFRKKNCK